MKPNNTNSSGPSPIHRLAEQFDPAQPLTRAESELYVNWQNDLQMDDVKTLMTRAFSRSRRPVCQFLTGHRGVGKSTELHRIKELLEADGFFVTLASSGRWPDVSSIQPDEVTFHMARQLVSGNCSGG